MINSLQTYRDAGKQTAIAANQRDSNRISHWTRWYTRALNLEKQADRLEVQTVYTAAYKENRK